MAKAQKMETVYKIVRKPTRKRRGKQRKWTRRRVRVSRPVTTPAQS